MIHVGTFSTDQYMNSYFMMPYFEFWNERKGNEGVVPNQIVPQSKVWNILGFLVSLWVDQEKTKNPYAWRKNLMIAEQIFKQIMYSISCTPTNNIN